MLRCKRGTEVSLRWMQKAAEAREPWRKGKVLEMACDQLTVTARGDVQS
jgi:hypothetical protein